MKNKKLFAILTLVCFMMTLMPVAAFAAPYIKNGSTMVPAVFFTNAFGIKATPLYDENGVCDVLFSK